MTWRAASAVCYHQPNPHVLRGEVTMVLCERWDRAPIPSGRGLSA